jgi:hypothetical protein
VALDSHSRRHYEPLSYLNLFHQEEEEENLKEVTKSIGEEENIKR